ncbi:MAG: zinc-ribbon domain-containing protein [Candidatus Bathyarchaeota archaeon]|nr:zinc-ribbon domain-containing protein [Candidatus Bathyarchaeota archaeon]
MPYCRKCGSELNEEIAFCPKCGTAVKPTETATPQTYTHEKGEKQEKNEKTEKQEKMEKNEQQEKYEQQPFSIVGSLFGGFILIFVGVMFYLAVTGSIEFSAIFPFFLIIIGVIVILGIAVGAVMAKKKNPMP